MIIDSKVLLGLTSWLSWLRHKPGDLGAVPGTQSRRRELSPRSCPLPPTQPFLPYPSLSIFCILQYSKCDAFKTAAYYDLVPYTWSVSSICMISICSILPFIGYMFTATQSLLYNMPTLLPCYYALISFAVV